MRLLLDESVPAKLRRHLPTHEVRTAVEMGWSGVKNGKLLVLAATAFDAFVTVDKNMPFQQNLSALPISLIGRSIDTNGTPLFAVLLSYESHGLPLTGPAQLKTVGAR